MGAMAVLLNELLAGESARDVAELCLDFELLRPQLSRPFSRVEGLEEFGNLESLSLCGHNMPELRGLPPLPHLRQLLLQHNELESLRGFPDFPLLRELDLSVNFLISLKELPQMPQLRQLNLAHNHLLDLKALPALPTLQSLVLSGNKRLKSLDGLENTPDLEELILSGCPIKDWAPLKALQRLKVLKMGLALAGDAGAILQNLPSLNEFSLEGLAKVRQIILPGHEGLHRLTLRKCAEIEEISLGNFPQLTELMISKTGLREVPVLRGRMNIIRMDLSHNRLQSLKGIENYPALQILGISGNQIPERELEALPPQIELI